jgi:hypothetical protein
MMLMQFLRRTGLVLAATTFFLMLFGFGMFWGIERTFGKPDAIKTAFRESGIYTSIVGDALDKAQKEEGQSGTADEIPVTRPEVRKIITDAFPPQFMQTQTENLLDGVYNWLNGKTKTLEFNLDLSDSKVRLADGVSKYVSQRLASLPTCTASDLSTMPSDVDPFNAPCVPPNYDVNAAAEKARQEILNGEFMKDTKITGADLKTSDGKTFDEQYKKGPAAYRNVKNAVYSMALVALLAGTAVVCLSVTRRAGLRKVAISSLVAGGMLVGVSWLTGVAIKRLAAEIAKQPEGSEPLQQKLIHIVQSLGSDVRSWWLWFGLIVAMAAIAGLVALHYTKPQDELTADLPTGPTGETPPPTEHTDPSKPTTHHHKTHN